MKYKAHEYTCIRAWGLRLGSFNGYIESQQKMAAEDEAPITAIYERDGVWHVAEDIAEPTLRKLVLGDHYDEKKHGQYGTEYDVVNDRFDRLPRVCAAYEYTEKKAILIYRGASGYTLLPDDFDVHRFNNQRSIRPEQIEAMLNGSMFGWHTEAADPANCKGEAS